MADSIVRDAFASIRGQDAPLSATSYLVLLAALLVASTWVYSRFQKNEPKNDFPPWVPLEIGVSSALIQVGGTASNILSVLKAILCIIFH